MRTTHGKIGKEKPLAGIWAVAFIANKTELFNLLILMFVELHILFKFVSHCI